MEANPTQKRYYRSSLLILLPEFIAVAFLSGFFLRLPYRLIAHFVFGIYIVRMRAAEIPVCHLIGLAIGIVFVMLRYTSICIEGRKLTIRQRFRKHSFWVSIQFKLEKRPIKSSFFSGELRWLSVKDVREDSQHRFRLYAFSGGTAQNLLNNLVEVCAKDTPSTIKSDIVQQSWEGNDRINIDSESIVRNEWKNVRLNSLIWIGITALFALILILSGDENSWNIKNIALLAASIICVLNIPFEFLRTKGNIRKRISEISFMGDHLTIDGDHYMIPDIVQLTVTHASVKSRSLYPVQRYIIIKSVDGTHKYWAGSEESISALDYNNIIRILMLAFINCPEKIRYVTKGTFWNT